MKRLNLRLLRLIKNSKGQFIAVTILIIIGLMIYTALSMAAMNLEDSVGTYYEETNFADIYVELVKIPQKGIEDLKNMKEVEKAEGRIVFDVPLKTRDEDEKVKVRVVSKPKNKEINQLFMAKGNNIENNQKEALVIEQFAKARNIDINDIITPQIQGKTYNFNVSGVVASPEYVYVMENEQSLLPTPEKFGIIYIEESFAGQIFGFKNSFNQVIVDVKENENLDDVKEKIEEKLDKYGVKRVYTRENQLSNSMISEEIKGVKKMSNTVPVIFLGVAAVIIAAMISRMIRNDRMSIGVMKALGYSNFNILSHYTKYSIIMGIAGSIMGIIFGTILSGQMTKMYIQFFNIPLLNFRFYPFYIANAILLSTIFCVGAGSFGARKILKIAPAESMRPEPPKKGGRVLLDKIDFIWDKLTFSWKMVLRNIFRNKKRILFITIGIAITFSITIMPFAMLNAMNEMFNKHYSEFQKMDYSINFNTPLNERVIEEVEHIVEVEDIEPKIEYPFELVNKTTKKVTNIIGIQRNTKFYEFTNIEGDVVNLPENGILLSEGVAKYLDVNKGDKIKVNTFIPGREDVFIEVVDIIRQSLGINGYMSINNMREKLTEKELVTGVYMDSDDDVKQKLEEAKNISSIQSTQDMIDTFKEFMDLTIFSLSIMILAGGILGFVIVYNSTIMNISERRLEFSSLRVMGFSRKEIFNIVTKENIIMTILGIILGIPLSKYMLSSLESMFSTDIYTLRIDVSLYSYILTILATTIFVVIAQLATYKKINNLDFIEALKNRIT